MPVMGEGQALGLLQPGPTSFSQNTGGTRIYTLLARRAYLQPPSGASRFVSLLSFFVASISCTSGTLNEGFGFRLRAVWLLLPSIHRVSGTRLRRLTAAPIDISTTIFRLYLTFLPSRSTSFSSTFPARSTPQARLAQRRFRL